MTIERHDVGGIAGAFLAIAALAPAACRVAPDPVDPSGPSGPIEPPSAAGAHEPTPPAHREPAPPSPPVPREPGASARFYFVGEPMDRVCALVANQTPNVSKVLATIDLSSDVEPRVGDFDSTFLAVIEGALEVRDPGRYGLRLSSDDGSVLVVDGTTAIDHDGLHAMTSRESTVELSAGAHPFQLAYFQNYGGFGVRLEWKPPSATEFRVVPTDALSCRAGEVRVTSPGPKKVLRPLEPGVPGDGLPLEGVHPSCALAPARPPDFEPKVGGMAWLPDGRLLVSTWDSIGAVYALEGVASGDPSKIRVARFAAGLAEPLGLCTVGDRVFVLQKQELTELVDTDADGVADVYRSVSSAWDVSTNFHEFAFGLVHVDGWLYFNLAVAIDPGGRSSVAQAHGRGSVVRVSLETGELELVARGVRTPNGIGVGDDGQIFVTDNQGDWLPASKLLHVEPGAFYGSRSVLLEAAEMLASTPPVLWLPQNEIGNSPSSPVLVPAGWGPYSGQMLHGDVTYGGIQRDFIERVDGVYQGCVFRFTQGLEAGVNRLSFGPDGALYAGGIGSTGNWGQQGKKSFGLERLAYTGRPAFEMLAVRALANGLEIQFTEPVAEPAAWDAENYRLDAWRYVPTADYGGPKVDERVLRVASASLAPDKTRVFLEVPDLAEGTVVHVHLVGPIAGVSGRRPWSTEAWYTLNRLPADRRGAVASSRPTTPHNVLSAEERAAGWELLFDGRSLAGWRGFGSADAARGWRAIDGELVHEESTGDLVTDAEYEDFELALEWKISAGGNSGIFFHVGDDHEHVWETGPEMQVLDNARHPDGRNPLTSAGANYALHAPARDATRPVGCFNQARLKILRGHVEHWLNGTKLLEYDLWTPEWRALVDASKFKSMPAYGVSKKGRIALQDHGDPVAYRDVKIRRLPPRKGNAK